MKPNIWNINIYGEYNKVNNQKVNNKNVKKINELKKRWLNSNILLKNLLYIIGSFSVILILWTIFTFGINKVNGNEIAILPYPFKVIKGFFYLLFNQIDGNTLINHANASLLRVFLGVSYAIILAIPTGIILGSNKRIARLFKPAIELIRPIPPIAWIPLAMITFGLGIASTSFIICIGAFFPLFQNTFDGIKNSNKVYRDVAFSLGAKKIEVALTITLPSITPNILTGIKISIGVGWMSVIAAELMGIDVNTGGIGYFINYMKNIGNYEYMLAGMLMIALIGLIITGVFNVIQNYLLKWMPEEE